MLKHKLLMQRSDQLLLGNIC